MARMIDSSYLLKHQRKVKFFGLGPDDESWGYAVPTEIIENAPALTPPNEPRMINADKLAKRIAGHSNYHGDSILAAIYCTAEGKENDAPIRPLETPPNEPLTLEQLREMDGEPVWVEEVEHWALIDIEKGGQWDGAPFAVWAENGAKFTYNIMNRNLHCYRRPPEGET